MRWFRLLLVILTLAGCNGIGVRPVKTPELFEAWHQSVPTDTLSARTMQTLRAWDLEQELHHDPSATLLRLQAQAEKDPEPDVVFAVAELAYLIGRHSEKRSSCDAIPYYFLSAGYAYHYLFNPNGASELVRAGTRTRDGLERFDPRASPFDPRFRIACDLYNCGLAKCIRSAQHIGKIHPGQELNFPTCDGQSFILSVEQRGFTWKPEEFGTLLLCEDFRTEGLVNQHRTHGLGVPLIAARATPEPDPDHGLYPPGVSFPVSAFFRFEGTLADLRARRAGRLELYNPLSVQAINVLGVTTPLETDLTTPLAFFLGRADLDRYGPKGFLRPDSVQRVAGVYLVEPYQRGKIPVLFVHGLLSSPEAWAPLYNDLLADPRLRERYQFWFYLYPTADPYIVTAADLRDSLATLRERFDPMHGDPALDNMVFIGHSMGGLVSRLLTVHSGDDFWHLVSAEPLDQLHAHPTTLQELKRVFFFDQQPYVKRVVFLGTPHHGSKLSPSLPARVLRYFVRLPGNLVNVASDLARSNPGFLNSLKPQSVPTSLDFLAPGAPALEILASRPKPPDVHYHSIIGVAPQEGLVRVEEFLAGARKNEKGDGVVPYSSAHIDGVDSELIIPAEHTQIHDHPFAIQEVRRILLEHLEATSVADAGAGRRARAEILPPGVPRPQ
jgi:pimeloyl-ACP methyl ester carboxylesterase